MEVERGRTEGAVGRQRKIRTGGLTSSEPSWSKEAMGAGPRRGWRTGAPLAAMRGLLRPHRAAPRYAEPVLCNTLIRELYLLTLLAPYVSIYYYYYLLKIGKTIYFSLSIYSVECVR